MADLVNVCLEAVGLQAGSVCGQPRVRDLDAGLADDAVRRDCGRVSGPSAAQFFFVTEADPKNKKNSSDESQNNNMGGDKTNNQVNQDSEHVESADEQILSPNNPNQSTELRTKTKRSPSPRIFLSETN